MAGFFHLFLFSGWDGFSFSFSFLAFELCSPLHCCWIFSFWFKLELQDGEPLEEGGKCNFDSRAETDCSVAGLAGLAGAACDPTRSSCWVEVIVETIRIDDAVESGVMIQGCIDCIGKGEIERSRFFCCEEWRQIMKNETENKEDCCFDVQCHVFLFFALRSLAMNNEASWRFLKSIIQCT